ncbi:SAM-dependent methyltransferase [Abditibacterium utsteinense]|uniref:SAM-dependent methyltransferase n=1 Tax=Abditibacterium utsteinense TaxID=1960156 RepID=A0A2S8SRX1_9BACT|nr:class I SAM-dependent methyltransferase [Abditibacterium utsteinense]PQV63553.1 SAM-dependent methyltransferase [Abditibacterium utsteinense]
MNTSFNEADQALFDLAKTLRDSGYHFTTVTPATHERVNARKENELAQNIAGIFGWNWPFAAEILPPRLWELMNLAGVAVPCGSLPCGSLWRSSVRLSSLSGQLFLHSAFPTVAADAVFFGPDTYRFALAIENLFASGLAPVQRAVDVGSGAGPGAIVTALARPDAEVLSVDINDAALRFARLNAALAGVTNLRACNSNLLRDVAGNFDLIVANPPYLVDASERTYRHGGGPLGAGLSLAIVDAALQRLTPGGTLLLYTGAAIVDGHDPFQAAVSQKMKSAVANWSYREVDPDVFGEELSGGAYARTDRIAAVVLTLTKST